VSEPVVREMAEGARREFAADVAVAVTGVAGPGGGTPVNPVGSVWIAVADSVGTIARHFLFSGSREMIRERAVAKALELVWRSVRGEDA
jgi:PncC family amidohydrolase